MPRTNQNDGSVKVTIAVPWCGRNVKKQAIYRKNPKYDVNIQDAELPKSAENLTFNCKESGDNIQVTIEPNMIENRIIGCDNCRFRMR